MFSISDKVVCVDDSNLPLGAWIRKDAIYVIRGWSWSNQLNEPTVLLVGVFTVYRTAQGLETGWLMSRFRKLADIKAESAINRLENPAVKTTLHDA